MVSFLRSHSSGFRTTRCCCPVKTSLHRIAVIRIRLQSVTDLIVNSGPLYDKLELGFVMDTSRIVQQVESMEWNEAFLQKEHRSLLSGLHQELRHLKKRCNELSCELNKGYPERHTEAIMLEEKLLQARLEETEDRLAKEECATDQLRRDLVQKGALASSQQLQLKDEERRFLEELKRRSHKITALGRQLRNQTDLAAQLAFQLHSVNLRLYHQNEEEEEEGEDGVLQTPNDSGAPTLKSPATESRHGGRSLAKRRRSERVRECVPSERVLQPEEPHNMPDPALFLYPFRHRLRPFHRPRVGYWVERGQSQESQRLTDRLRDQSLQEEMGSETTEL